MLIAQNLWSKAWEEASDGVDLANARVGGRTSKAFPNRENIDFWQQYGPEWVQSYIEWRINNPNWKIWKTPQGAPAIELGLTPAFADVPVKMVIDRVFEVNGDLVVVDLKTSKTVPSSSLQLGLYALGLKQTFGVEVKYGTFWMARLDGTIPLMDLSYYTEDKINYMLSSFDKARKQGLFIPNINNCNRCGLTSHCEFYSKNG